MNKLYTMKLKTEHYILGAAAAAVVYAITKKQSPAVGAKNEIIDSREESLRLAVQMRLFDLDDKYEEREAENGAMLSYKRNNQRVGQDYKEQKRDLTEEINQSGRNWLIDSISWTVDGSYGMEFKYYFKRLLSSADTRTAKTFNKFLDSFTIQVVTQTILAENYDLNRKQIVDAVKAAQPGKNEELLQHAKQIIIEYYLGEANLF